MGSTYASEQIAAPRRPAARAPVRRPLPLPWRDPRGRFSWFKAAVCVGVLVPGIDLAVTWATGNAGARPVLATILGCGLWTIRFLLITLAITPARRLLNWPRLVTARRLLGLTALCYAIAHFSLYVVMENFKLPLVASEIVNHIYLTIGFVVLTGLCVLGATSTDAAVRRMKQGWKRLHRILYVLVPLGILHFFMQSKANVSAAVLVAGFFYWLMLWRALPGRQEVRLLPLLALALISAAAAAATEFAWYGIATHANPMRVLEANLHISRGLRPAVWVLLVALGVALLAVTRHRGAMLAARWRGRAPRSAS